MYKICIADDEHYIIQSIRCRIEASGLDTEVCGTARNGWEAFELYRKVRPDIYYVDVDMPGCNGLQFIDRVRNTDEACRTKFIIVSGYDNFEYLQQAIRAGVVDYIMKPIRQEEFSATLQAICRKIQPWQKEDEKYGNHNRTVPDKANEHSLRPEEATVQTDVVVEAIRGYLEENYAGTISLSELSKRFFLAANYMNKRFKSRVGIPIMQYLENYRVAKAKEYLGNTEHSISDIAGMVGYSDANYFTRIFRKNCGISPGAFKKMRHETQK